MIMDAALQGDVAIRRGRVSLYLRSIDRRRDHRRWKFIPPSGRVARDPAVAMGGIGTADRWGRPSSLRRPQAQATVTTQEILEFCPDADSSCKIPSSVPFRRAPPATVGKV